eukprot:TRINITY_DN1271_c0_g1_i2.p1 TRINITY_DN1271_c0_g1~~TRINITY_DN1271_c0_g1_i2.p1  ORF type:complete len:120 (-),score=15.01 TRINITY_DN1271_c0_g1_i2:45-404(-)
MCIRDRYSTRIDSIMVASQDKIHNKRIVDTYGLVTGNTVRARNIFIDFFASMRSIIGGESVGYTELLRQAREEALHRVRQAAADHGANAVVGFRYSTTSGPNNMMEILAYGTAVTVEDK